MVGAAYRAAPTRPEAHAPPAARHHARHAPRGSRRRVLLRSPRRAPAARGRAARALRAGRRPRQRRARPAHLGRGVRRPRAGRAAPAGRGPRSTAAAPGRGCSTGCSSRTTRRTAGSCAPGRHEGDWEMVQYRLRGGRLVQAVYAQHSGAESCGFGGRAHARAARPRRLPRARLARRLLHAGLRDRTWPDPNDEADGRGLRVRPRLVRIDRVDAGVDALSAGAGAPPARAGSRARWTRRAGRRSSRRAAGRTRRPGPRRRGRARGGIATAAGSATGARPRSRRCWPGSGCWGRCGWGCGGCGGPNFNTSIEGRDGSEAGTPDTSRSMQAVDVRRHHRGDEVRLRLAQRRHRSAIHSPVHPPQSPGLQQHPPLRGHPARVRHPDHRIGP